MLKKSFLLFTAMTLGLLFQASHIEIIQRGRAQERVVPVPQLAQAPAAKAAEQPKKPAKKYGRGHVQPSKEVRDNRHRVSNKRHGDLIKNLPKATAATYDARTLGIIPPVGDQGSCGDCYAWSGCKASSGAQMAAKIVPQDGKFMLAVSYFLDCQSVGGCGGGDEYQVAQIIHSSGAPSQAQYGGDGQSPGRCKSTSGMTLYTISKIVMVGSESGVAATQDIKNAIQAYGYVSVAADANNWDNVGDGTITGRGNNIDHAIGLVGWDDTHDNGDGTKGAWIMQNNWSTSWGGKCVTLVNPNPTEPGGYAWIKYGADSIGTESFICIAGSGPVPPAPPGPGPGPGPAPGGQIVITSALTATGSVGGSFSYQIAATGSPTDYAAAGLPSGLSCAASTGLISGTPDSAGSFKVTISASNPTVGPTTAVLSLTVSGSPPGPVGPTITVPQSVPAGTYVLVPANSNMIIITADMTLKEIIEAATKKQSQVQVKTQEPPLAGKTQAELAKELADLRDGLTTIMRWMKLHSPQKEKR